MKCKYYVINILNQDLQALQRGIHLQALQRGIFRTNA